MQRRVKLAFLGLLLFAGAYGFYVFWSPQAYVRGSFSLSDACRIRFAIRAETFQKILRIYQETDGTVSVETGVVRGPLDGGGQFYRFKRTFSGWEQIESGVWTS